MQALHPSAKAGIVLLGFFVAWAAAWIVMDLREWMTQGPDRQSSSGMYAFGDLLLGIAVFGVLVLIPLGLALYWLRPVARFWSVLLWGTVLFASTGLLALGANIVAGRSTSMWMFAAQARIGIMPLSALALLACAIFTPRPRDRLLLLAATASEGAIFLGVLLFRFILPNLGR